MTSKKKKVLIRINTLRGGGAEKVLTTVLKYINYNKYDIDLLVNKKGYVHDKNIDVRVNFKYLFKSSSILGRNGFYNFFYKLIRELGLQLYNSFPQLLYKLGILKNYEIEFAFLEDMAPFIAKSPLSGSKKIAWIHIDLLGLPTLSDKKKKKICNFLKYFEKVIVPSDKVGTNLIKLCDSYNIDTYDIKPNIQVIYYPIDTQEIIEKSTEPLLEPMITTQPVLIAIATLSKQKRFDRLIKAHKKLVNDNIPNTLWIVGEGPMRSDLEKLILELDLKETVKLLGFQLNPFPFLKKADLFVLSSDQEGFPLVLTEALILEKPVVATSIAGTTEMLNNGEFGMLVSPNEDDLYKGLKELLTNKKSYLNSIEKAKAGKSQFNYQQNIEKIEKIFDA